MESKYEIFSDTDLGNELHTVIRTGTDEEIDISKLTKEYFDYLGEWKLFMNDNVGMAYRFGMKDGFTDNEGDPMGLYFHFGVPIANRGYEITEQDYDLLIQKFHTMIELSSKIWAMQNDKLHVVSIAPKTPEYMYKELIDLL